MKRHDEALKDSELAVVLAVHRGDRGKRAKAQFRRAISLQQLGRFKDAKFCLDLAVEADYPGKDLALWKAKIEAAAAKGMHPTFLPIPTKMITIADERLNS